MALPKNAQSIQSEDLDTLQITTKELFDQFVKPIDAIRSQALPSVISQNTSAINDFNNLQVSNTQIFESRCHAFYRMLGFPITSGNSFYNPGFLPQSLKNKEKNENIKKSFYQNNYNLYQFIIQREQAALNKKNIFLKQDLSSCLYAVLLKFTPLFHLFEPSNPFQVDQQKFTITDRQLELQRIAEINSSMKDKILQSGTNFVTIQKILKPFIVEPRIEATITPDTLQICAPFLPTKESCQIQKDIFLSRPGLEAILRQRLSNQSSNSLFLQQAENLLKSVKMPGIDISTISTFSLIDSLQALSDKNQLSNSIKELFKDFSDYQIIIINQLTKYLKLSIKKMVEAINIIDDARFQINWFPLPSNDGPITGIVGAKLSSVGLQNENISVTEQKIFELKIKKLNAERDSFSIQDFGTFASPFENSSNLENSANLQDEINKLEKKKNQISENAFNALSEIEMLYGEIAGIGLIDVIAIYLTLWSLDLKTLIYFLDTNSFKRMIQYNPQFLSIKEVQDRNNSEQLSIQDVLIKFEHILSNILLYCDKVFAGYFFNHIEV